MTDDHDEAQQNPATDGLGVVADVPPLSAPRLTVPPRRRPATPRSTEDSDQGSTTPGSGENAVVVATAADERSADGPPAVSAPPPAGDGQPVEPDLDNPSTSEEPVVQENPDRRLIKPLLAAAGIAVLVLGGGWALMRPGAEEVAEPSRSVESTGKLPSRPPIITTSAVIAGDIPIALTMSDGGCPGVASHPERATSKLQTEAWVCMTQGVLFGQTLTACFGGRYSVTKVSFWPGFNGVGADGRPEWDRHRVIKEAQLVFDDDDRTPIPAYPDGKQENYVLPINNISARCVTMTILKTDSPPPVTQSTATAGPPADTGLPDLRQLPGGGASDTPEPGSGQDPAASSVAVWGFTVEGHRS